MEYPYRFFYCQHLPHDVNLWTCSNCFCLVLEARIGVPISLFLLPGFTLCRMHKYTLSDLHKNILMNVILRATCAGKVLREGIKDRLASGDIELTSEEVGAIKLALVEIAKDENGGTFAALLELAAFLKIRKAFLKEFPAEEVLPVLAFDDDVEE